MSADILAVLTAPETAARCLAAASAAAPPGGTVTACHIRVPAESLIVLAEEVLTEKRRGELKTLLDTRSAALRQIAEDAAIRWEEIESESVAAGIAARGRQAALIVLARPREPEGEAALRAILFETGRLLLLPPPDPGPLAFGRHMAVAWKASDPARRAIAAALPWLTQAERVSVLAADTPPDEALALLSRHGIAAEAVPVASGEGGVGARLLRQAAAIGADSLVMGAYRHSRLIELVVGGVTRHLLSAAGLPLLMMH